MFTFAPVSQELIATNPLGLWSGEPGGGAGARPEADAVTANQAALGLSIVTWGVLAGLFMKHKEWMRPHMTLVLTEYGERIGAYLAAAAICLYPGLYWTARWLGIG